MKPAGLCTIAVALLLSAHTSGQERPASGRNTGAIVAGDIPLEARALLSATLDDAAELAAARKADPRRQQNREDLQAVHDSLRSSAKEASEANAVDFCVTTLTALCLNGRFQVAADFIDNSGGEPVLAGVVQFTRQSGYLWFLDASNAELIVKHLNACGGVASPSSHWIFAAGLTNFDVLILVRDAMTRIDKWYYNPPGVAFQPIIDQDTDADLDLYAAPAEIVAPGPPNPAFGCP